MPTYAKNTEVSSIGSRLEIERTLQKFGATAFVFGWEGPETVIGFQINGRKYRITMNLPDRNDDKFKRTPARGYVRSKDEADKAWEQECREYWRSLSLYIKGVLAADEIGIVAVEIALMPFVMLPSGQTVGEWMAPQIDDAYSTGKMPPLLPG